jgi:hypothetical protein
MSVPPRLRPSVNWDLLWREARMALARQPGWLAIGLGGGLAIALYSLFRPWFANRAQDNLLQAALFFADWNILFGTLYACAAWLRPKQEETEREQHHLPLSTTHFELRRMIHTSAVPLAAAVLSLPLWAVLLLYYQVPYGVDGQAQNWAFMGDGMVSNPWWPRIAWIAAGMLSAACLPAALAAWLDALTPVRYFRCVLMLAVPAGMYFAARLAAGWDYVPGPASSNWGDYGPMVMNYRETRGVSPWPYLILLGILVLGPVLYGWLRPAGRWALLAVPVLVLGAFMLRKALPEEVREVFRPVSTAVFGIDARYASGLFVGHLAPPKDMRMLMWTYPSNVLFAKTTPLVEPTYPEYPDAGPEPQRKDYASDRDLAAAQQAYAQKVAALQKENEQAVAAYDAAEKKYEEAYARQPRLPLWATAGLYPLLAPVWAVAGLLLGTRLRGEPARDR